MVHAERKKICLIATVSITIKAFCIDLITGMNNEGMEVTIICKDTDKLRSILPEDVKVYDLGFSRLSSPLKDLHLLFVLTGILRREKFDMVQYVTPKAAFLGSIASFMAGVPLRLYLLWGLYYESRKNFKKILFEIVEKVTCFLSTHILPNSHKMCETIIKRKFAKKSKCEVILYGSACGINLDEYDSAKWPSFRKETRSKFKISERAVVIGVFGRLTGDKGINETVSAFLELSENHDNLYLLVVGSYEEKDRPLFETMKVIDNHPRIIRLEWQKSITPFYTVIDIFCIATYREGFPQTPLEAQAMEVPVVATNINGCSEAVQNGVAGFLVEPRSAKALIEPLKRLIGDEHLRKQMGKMGRKRIEEMFDGKKMVKAIIKHRQSLLRKQNAPNSFTE